MRKLKMILAVVALFVCGAAPAVAQGGTLFPKTPHFQFCLPPNGVSGWGTCYNGSMTTIDNTLWQLQNPYQGAWNSAITYRLASIVTYSGATYLSTVANNAGVTPGTSSSWLALGSSSGGGGCTGITGNYSLNNQIATVDSGCVTAIGTPFSMGLSCPQAGQRETGNATANPFTCTLSYANGTVASASLSDGTNTDTLSSPFTAATLAFAYSSATTFTAHSSAVDAQTAVGSVSVSFANREFAGIGTAGATGATASGANAVLVGATGTLASPGLGVHSTFGPFTASNQKVYVLGLSSSCTFTSGGFDFPMIAPVSFSFVNQYGSTTTIWDYESVNLLSDTFTLNGTC